MSTINIIKIKVKTKGILILRTRQIFKDQASGKEKGQAEDHYQDEDQA
jgi:hypothetical protein